MAIDTKTAERRKLRFNSMDDLLTEIARIVAADKAGKLRQTGNWTAGQNFGHLATWINYGYEGYPMKVPWFIRLLIRMKRKAYIRDGMPSGVHIPGVEGGTYGREVISTDEGATRLRRALQRLRSEPPRYHSPAFGEMSQAEREAFNLRHAELHLGFLHY